MKTRIKVVTDNNGKSTYIPQYKGLLFWKVFKEFNGWDYTTLQFNSLEACKKLIDSKLTTVKYIKYP